MTEMIRWAASFRTIGLVYSMVFLGLTLTTQLAIVVQSTREEGYSTNNSTLVESYRYRANNPTILHMHADKISTFGLFESNPTRTFGCSANADCVDTSRTCVHETCVCVEEFNGESCELCKSDHYTGKCGINCDELINCSAHGRCSGQDGSCLCFEGWSGPYCNLSLPQLCPEHFFGPFCETSCDAVVNCSAQGRCRPDGDCLCFSGWIGDRCHLNSSNVSNLLQGKACTINLDCGGPQQGECISGRCRCWAGHKGLNCVPCAEDRYGTLCTADCAEERDCSGHGRCSWSAPGACNCFPGWGGSACNLTAGRCDTDVYGQGCDVACSWITNCSGHGRCTESGGCSCFVGWAGIVCEQQVTQSSITKEGLQSTTATARVGPSLQIYASTIHADTSIPPTDRPTITAVTSFAQLADQRTSSESHPDDSQIRVTSLSSSSFSGSLTIPFSVPISPYTAAHDRPDDSHLPVLSTNISKTCREGQYAAACDRPCNEVVNCSGQGRCAWWDGSCLCFDGWAGDRCDSSASSLPSKAEGCATDADCGGSGLGECRSLPAVAKGRTCACAAGRTGLPLLCWPCADGRYGGGCQENCDEIVNCSGHGRCSDFKGCLCFKGWGGIGCKLSDQQVPKSSMTEANFQYVAGGGLSWSSANNVTKHESSTISAVGQDISGSMLSSITAAMDERDGRAGSSLFVSSSNNTTFVGTFDHDSEVTGAFPDSAGTAVSELMNMNRSQSINTTALGGTYSVSPLAVTSANTTLLLTHHDGDADFSKSMTTLPLPVTTKPSNNATKAYSGIETSDQVTVFASPTRLATSISTSARVNVNDLEAILTSKTSSRILTSSSVHSEKSFTESVSTTNAGPQVTKSVSFTETESVVPKSTLHNSLFHTYSTTFEPILTNSSLYPMATIAYMESPQPRKNNNEMTNTLASSGFFGFGSNNNSDLIAASMVTTGSDIATAQWTFETSASNPDNSKYSLKSDFLRTNILDVTSQKITNAESSTITPEIFSSASVKTTQYGALYTTPEATPSRIITAFVSSLVSDSTKAASFTNTAPLRMTNASDGFKTAEDVTLSLISYTTISVSTSIAPTQATNSLSIITAALPTSVAREERLASSETLTTRAILGFLAAGNATQGTPMSKKQAQSSILFDSSATFIANTPAQAPLPKPTVLFTLPTNGFAGRIVPVTVAISNFAPWLTNASVGGLSVAAAMQESNVRLNTSILKVSIDSEVALITLWLQGVPGGAGYSNVTLSFSSKPLRVQASLVSWRFAWLPADQPVISGFDPQMEITWGGTQMSVSVANAPGFLGCANVSCRFGPGGPQARCTSVSYSSNIASDGSRLATATFVLPAAKMGAGNVQPMLYLGNARVEGQTALELLFPANFTYRDPPAPSIVSVLPSTSAAGVSAMVSVTIFSFPAALATEDIVATFQWNVNNGSNGAVKSQVSMLEWLDGTSVSAAQTLRFVVAAPSNAPPGPATLRVTSSRFSSVFASTLFLFVDLFQPQVCNYSVQMITHLGFNTAETGQKCFKKD